MPTINILLLLIFVCLVGVGILIISLIDRVRKMEVHASSPRSVGAVAAVAPATTDARFAGVDGQRLWNLMIAADDKSGAGNGKAAELRAFYPAVLERHIEELFEEGVLDSRQGVRVPPAPVRLIKTSGGHVASWLPPADSNEIYAIGQERNAVVGGDYLALKGRLEVVSAKLCQLAKLQATPAMVGYLLPATVGSSAVGASLPSGQVLELAQGGLGAIAPPAGSQIVEVIKGSS